MKANEAPEKIYIHPNIGDREFIKPWLKRPFNENSVEYIRADAFIEKALKFIKTNVDRIVNNQHGVCMGCMDKEFKEYINRE